MCKNVANDNNLKKTHIVLQMVIVNPIFSNRTAYLIILAKTICPKIWTTEYQRYLMTNHYTQKRNAGFSVLMKVFQVLLLTLTVLCSTMYKLSAMVSSVLLMILRKNLPLWCVPSKQAIIFNRLTICNLIQVFLDVYKHTLKSF